MSLIKNWKGELLESSTMQPAAEKAPDNDENFDKLLDIDYSKVGDIGKMFDTFDLNAELRSLKSIPKDSEYFIKLLRDFYAPQDGKLVLTKTEFTFDEIKALTQEYPKNWKIKKQKAIGVNAGKVRFSVAFKGNVNFGGQIFSMLDTEIVVEPETEPDKVKFDYDSVIERDSNDNLIELYYQMVEYFESGPTDETIQKANYIAKKLNILSPKIYCFLCEVIGDGKGYKSDNYRYWYANLYTLLKPLGLMPYSTPTTTAGAIDFLMNFKIDSTPAEADEEPETPEIPSAKYDFTAPADITDISFDKPVSGEAGEFYTFFVFDGKKYFRSQVASASKGYVTISEYQEQDVLIYNTASPDENTPLGVYLERNIWPHVMRHQQESENKSDLPVQDIITGITSMWYEMKTPDKAELWAYIEKLSDKEKVEQLGESKDVAFRDIVASAGTKYAASLIDENNISASFFTIRNFYRNVYPKLNICPTKSYSGALPFDISYAMQVFTEMNKAKTKAYYADRKDFLFARAESEYYNPQPGTNENDAILLFPECNGEKMPDVDVPFEDKRCEHVEIYNALQTLKMQGLAAILLPGGINFNNLTGDIEPDRDFYNWLMENYNVTDLIPIDSSLFLKCDYAAKQYTMVLIRGQKVIPTMSPMTNDPLSPLVKLVTTPDELFERILMNIAEPKWIFTPGKRYINVITQAEAEKRKEDAIKPWQMTLYDYATAEGLPIKKVSEINYNDSYEATRWAKGRRVTYDGVEYMILSWAKHYTEIKEALRLGKKVPIENYLQYTDLVVTYNADYLLAKMMTLDEFMETTAIKQKNDDSGYVAWNVITGQTLVDISSEEYSRFVDAIGVDGYLKNLYREIYQPSKLTSESMAKGKIRLAIAQLRIANGLDKPKLFAPNGLPSNLTPEAYKAVRTDSFKKWFGDWERAVIISGGVDFTNEAWNDVSKMVDENGEPMIVYHGSGTKERFNVFEIGTEVQSHPVIYFAKEKGYSSIFEKLGEGNLYECFINIKNPLDARNLGWDNVDGYMLIQFLRKHNILNLIYPSMREQDEIKDTFDSKWWQIMRSRQLANQVVAALKIAGYDGILQFEDFITPQRTTVTQSFLILRSNQVKLADGTNVDFDAENDDIRFGEGGKICNCTH